jgi:hypothetical protein
MAIGVMAATAITTGPAQAVTTNGPYYAEPAWDQKLSATTRFVVLSDWNSEAVLDRETGLVWEQAPSTVAQTWGFARRLCLQSAKGGRRGWRLPSITELLSLIDPSVASPGPTLPPGHPFTNVQSSGGYWSVTTNAQFPTAAWIGSFGGASTVGFVVKGEPDGTETEFVWCVRGAMNADAY